MSDFIGLIGHANAEYWHGFQPGSLVVAKVEAVEGLPVVICLAPTGADYRPAGSHPRAVLPPATCRVWYRWVESGREGFVINRSFDSLINVYRELLRLGLLTDQQFTRESREIAAELPGRPAGTFEYIAREFWRRYDLDRKAGAR